MYFLNLILSLLSVSHINICSWNNLPSLVDVVDLRWKCLVDLHLLMGPVRSDPFKPDDGTRNPWFLVISANLKEHSQHLLLWINCTTNHPQYITASSCFRSLQEFLRIIAYHCIWKVLIYDYCSPKGCHKIIKGVNQQTNVVPKDQNVESIAFRCWVNGSFNEHDQGGAAYAILSDKTLIQYGLRLAYSQFHMEALALLMGLRAAVAGECFTDSEQFAHKLKAD